MAEEDIRPFDRREQPGPSLPVGPLVAVAVLALAGIGMLIYAFGGGAFGDDPTQVPASISPTLPAAPRTPIATVLAPTASAEATVTVASTDTALTTPADTATVTPTAAPPTATPTPGVLATSAPATAVPPTQTPAPPAPAAAHGVTGQLTLCVSKTSYATNIERVCFVEQIVNTTSQTVTYGVLGVQATNVSGGPSKFQTSWRGGLSLGPNCTGPRDTCGGSWEDGVTIETPGTYVLTLAICYSDMNTCLGSGGDWETLTSGITIQVVNWTPSP